MRKQYSLIELSQGHKGGCVSTGRKAPDPAQGVREGFWGK